MNVMSTKCKTLVALCAITALTACEGGAVNDSGTGGYSAAPAAFGGGPTLPADLQACAAGLTTPGCDKNAAGKTLATMSTDPGVLQFFSNQKVASITLRATADGMRYGVDPVSCEDITAYPVAFYQAAGPGQATELGAFVEQMSRDMYAKKGCL